MPFIGALGDETKDSAVESMSIVDVDMRHVEEAEANYRVRGKQFQVLAVTIIFLIQREIRKIWL